MNLVKLNVQFSSLWFQTFKSQQFTCPATRGHYSLPSGESLSYRILFYFISFVLSRQTNCTIFKVNGFKLWQWFFSSLHMSCHRGSLFACKWRKFLFPHLHVYLDIGKKNKKTPLWNFNTLKIFARANLFQTANLTIAPFDAKCSRNQNNALWKSVRGELWGSWSAANINHGCSLKPDLARPSFGSLHPSQLRSINASPWSKVMPQIKEISSGLAAKKNWPKLQCILQKKTPLQRWAGIQLQRCCCFNLYVVWMRVQPRARKGAGLRVKSRRGRKRRRPEQKLAKAKMCLRESYIMHSNLVQSSASR